VRIEPRNSHKVSCSDPLLRTSTAGFVASRFLPTGLFAFPQFGTLPTGHLPGSFSPDFPHATLITPGGLKRLWLDPSGFRKCGLPLSGFATNGAGQPPGMTPPGCNTRSAKHAHRQLHILPGQKVLRRQYFTSAWKHARVVSIQKTDKDPTLPSSCRPVSLLNTVGKLFERILLARVLRERKPARISA
jgi:hypothetical protein